MSKPVLPHTVSSLSAWLDRRHPGFPYAEEERVKLCLELGGFIGIDIKVPIHESGRLPAQSLAASWEAVHDYVDQALEVINAEEPCWLDKEEVSMIREEVGEPPPFCYPIYFISVDDGSAEELVYIGKTSSSKGRFSGGHAAVTKLHHPDYDGKKKWLYLGCVALLTEDRDILPLEFVSPMQLSLQLLDSVERQLIYYFKPPLNTQGKAAPSATMPCYLQIQNFRSRFLDGKFV